MNRTLEAIPLTDYETLKVRFVSWLKDRTLDADAYAPAFREAARRYRIALDDVEMLADDCMDVVIVRPGNRRAESTLEWMGD